MKRSKTKTEGARGVKPIALVAVAIAVAAAVWFLKPAGAPASAAAEESTEPAAAAAAEEAEEGPVAMIEPITLNLADGHYLKVGLALQTVADPAAGGGHGEGEALPEGATAKASDIAITRFGREEMAALADPEHRAQVKAELVAEISEAYHGTVTDVYFTEFVME